MPPQQYQLATVFGWNHIEFVIYLPLSLVQKMSYVRNNMNSILLYYGLIVWFESDCWWGGRSWFYTGFISFDQNVLLDLSFESQFPTTSMATSKWFGVEVTLNWNARMIVCLFIFSFLSAWSRREAKLRWLGRESSTEAWSNYLRGHDKRLRRDIYFQSGMPVTNVFYANIPVISHCGKCSQQLLISRGPLGCQRKGSSRSLTNCFIDCIWQFCMNGQFLAFSYIGDAPWKRASSKLTTRCPLDDIAFQLGFIAIFKDRLKACFLW